MLAIKGKKKINNWEEAIAQANYAISNLRALIATCQQQKTAGHPFPRGGSWDKAIFNATCHLAKLEETVNSFRTNKDAGHPWPGNVPATIN